MSRIHYRPAQTSDGEQVFKLAEQFATSFAVERAAFGASFRELLDQEHASLMVAADGDDIVGYVLAFDHPAFFANGKVTWVEEIMVADDRRRQGIGNALMRTVETWAIGRSSKMIALATRRAGEFYISLGYQESATYFRKVL